MRRISIFVSGLKGLRGYVIESLGQKCTEIIPNQWIVFFARSVWLLKLGKVSTIHLPAFSGFRARVFLYFSEKKELICAGYPLVWHILKQLFTSVSVKSGR